jgi:nicotinate phosphoribosyltransferase
LKQQKAAINVWGVGTRLVTAHPDAALGGVYKLSALKRSDGSWEPKIKLSDQVAKITNPGILQVRRFRNQRELVGDAIYDQSRPLPERVTVIDPVDPTRRKRLGPGMSWEDLLVPVFRKGKQVYTTPGLKSARERAAKQLAMLHPGIKRFENPHRYPAGLEQSVHELKMKLVLEARGEDE